MHYTFAPMIAAALLTSAAASAASDPNVGQANKSNAQADRAAVSALAAAKKKPCAVATMAGPGSNFDITLKITNLSVAQLSFATIDPFRALNGAALIFETATVTSAPSGGTATILYPSSGGEGPAVASFTSFDKGDSASLSFDPDTYDDPSFGATVRQMDNTRIEVAYAGGLRCAGQLKFNPGLNLSVAQLQKTSP